MTAADSKRIRAIQADAKDARPAQHADLVRDLPGAQREQVQAYVDGDYSRVSTALRSAKGAQGDPTVAALDEALAPLETDALVYKRASLAAFGKVSPADLVGKVV